MGKKLVSLLFSASIITLGNLDCSNEVAFQNSQARQMLEPIVERCTIRAQANTLDSPYGIRSTVYRSADQDGNGVISLDESALLVASYNTGNYQCR